VQNGPKELSSKLLFIYLHRLLMDFTDLFFTRQCSDAVKTWRYLVTNFPQNMPVKLF